ncbi:MAG: hypothetical protein WC457_02590 [Patescibacteria group bacterium]
MAIQGLRRENGNFPSGMGVPKGGEGRPLNQQEIDAAILKDIGDEDINNTVDSFAPMTDTEIELQKIEEAEAAKINPEEEQKRMADRFSKANAVKILEGPEYQLPDNDDQEKVA